MRKTRSKAAIAALTLVETLIYAAMGCVVSLIAYSALRSAAILAVKNTNLNRSHDDLRGSYDRLARHLLSSSSVPTLIDSTGATVTTTYTADSGNTATGPAAGFSSIETLGDLTCSIQTPRRVRSRPRRPPPISGFRRAT